jgi:hypothetical protein
MLGAADMLMDPKKMRKIHTESTIKSPNSHQHQLSSTCKDPNAKLFLQRNDKGQERQERQGENGKMIGSFSSSTHHHHCSSDPKMETLNLVLRDHYETVCKNQVLRKNIDTYTKILSVHLQDAVDDMLTFAKNRKRD